MAEDNVFRPARGDQPLYLCQQCEEPVLVFEGKIFRTCEHAEAAVLANMNAIAYSTGQLSQ